MQIIPEHILAFFRPRCDFCKSKAGQLDRIHDTFGYHTDTYTWHKECLEDVICDPEKHGHNVVDLALKIDELVSTRDRQRRKAKERQQLRLSDAQKRHCSDV